MNAPDDDPSSANRADSRDIEPALILLVGNPNAGKTALFNSLTGLRAKTANYPGITVDLRTGPLDLAGRTVELIDLPGLYSLDAITPEEKVAEDALRGRLRDVSAATAVVLVIDATNVERNLFLASQVLELGFPTIVALNLTDAARSAGIATKPEQLAESLKCVVVPVSSRTGEGIDSLRSALSELLHDTASFDSRGFCACPEAGCHECSFAARFEWAAGVAQQAVQTPETYGSTTAAIDRVVTQPVVGLAVFLTVMLTVFYLIFAMAAVPMGLIEQGFAWAGRLGESLIPATGGVLFRCGAFLASIGAFAAAYRTAGIKLKWWTVTIAAAVSLLVAALPVEDFRSLAVDGVIGGVGAVVVFVPQICILFVFISLMEDCGYLARAAFLTERVMRRVGLPGSAFVPMLSAHACAIPGIMAARVINDWRDRLVTILVLPLLTCSARLPVYAMLSAMLFRNSPVKAAGVFLGAYLLGIGAALATAWCLKKSLLRGETAPMVLELPPYRWPSLRDALLTTSDRAGVFVRRAGSVILLISVVLWALANYPKLPENRLAEFTATPVSQTRPAGDDAHTADAALSSEQDLAQEQLSFSFAGRIGRVMEPIFRPLGFDSRINVGILSSFAAREVFVSTMAILYGMDEDSSEDSGTLTDTLLRQRHPDGTPVFTTATSASLLVFFVLAMQCAPTQAVTMRETGSWKWAALQLAYMTVLAYLAALVVYQTMSLFPDTQRWALGG